MHDPAAGASRKHAEELLSGEQREERAWQQRAESGCRPGQPSPIRVVAVARRSPEFSSSMASPDSVAYRNATGLIFSLHDAEESC